MTYPIYLSKKVQSKILTSDKIKTKKRRFSGKKYLKPKEIES